MDIAAAKAHLGDLVTRAEAGETITIERRGKPVAKLVPAEADRETIDVEALRAMVESMRKPGPLPENPVIAMRREARY